MGAPDPGTQEARGDGDPLANHIEAIDVPADGGGHRGADDIVAGDRGQGPQLGLPVLLDTRRVDDYRAFRAARTHRVGDEVHALHFRPDAFEE